MVSVGLTTLPIAPPAWAQFTADFQTNTISGVVSNWAGDNGTYVVGSNTFFNTLRIISTGILSNGSGFVGYETLASNNTVLVSDTGSRWTNRFDIFLGIGSTGNRLVVSNQGAVFSRNGYLGFNTGGSNNGALVSNTGSVWRVSTNLFVGYFTPGNSLIVSNGATVFDLAGTIGFTNAPGNRAWVGGGGSVWSNAFNLFVGYHNAGNELVVTNGGTVFSGDGYVGAAVGGSNNTATITGSGSVWRSTNTLNVGYLGSSNALFITGGGKVIDQSGYVGTNAVSTGNWVLVAGSGSIWSNTANLFIGHRGSDNQLVITNGATVIDAAGTLGFTNTSVRNMAFIDGAGSAWSNAVFCYIGYFGAGNQLIVSNGATLFSGTGFIGAGNIASNNTATITGSGSTWANTNFLNVGFVGSSNKLVIADGGRASSPETRIGFDPLAGNNVALVTGPGAVLSNSVNTIVGYGGTSNQLIVAAGGAVFDQVGNVGYTNQSSRNIATVTGSGSVWSNTTTMYVGFKSASNQLVVADGGKVFDNEGYIGANLPASNNYAIVTGPGSLWENVANLYVGYMGTNNQLTVADGGVASAFAGTIGFDVLSPRSTVLVTDPSSLYSNGLYTYVGYNGAFNQLIVSNGGAARSGIGYIGAFNLASNNAVTITGTGSLWTVTNLVYVGYSGDRNSLSILNGGTVRSLAGQIGFDTTTVSNTVIVSGPGSLWSNSLTVMVGVLGVANTLIITNGGVVYDNGGGIGSTAATSNNLAIVTGAGSVWSNVNGVTVGAGGRSNRLVIANGGKVTGPSHSIGSSGSTNNSALVTGPGSVWMTGTNFSDEITVGNSSRGNSLVISNGGAAISRQGIIGDSSFGTGFFNTGIVNGVSSVWSNTGTFSIGIYGYRNHLTITNGGALYDTEGILGAGAFGSGSNNTALVTGPGSLWDNTGSLTLGLGGNSNRLTVANLGKVTAANLFIGDGGSTIGNQLILSNGLVEAASITVSLGNLTGSGTVSGNVLNNGIISANISGATLTFNGAVKNQGTLQASSGGIIEFYGLVLNLGITNFTGGTAIFHGPVFSTTGTTNSWIFAGDGPWHTAARWSLGVTPSSSNAVVLITNATTKTVNVNAATYSTAPGSVTNSHILVSGPAGTTNTLHIQNTPAPFFALNLTVRTNAALIVTNATVEVGLLDTGTLTVDGTLRVVGGALLDARNAGTVTLGNGASASTIIEDSSMLAKVVNLGFGSVTTTTLVTGAGAVWSNDQAIVYNNSQLILSNGAQAASSLSAIFYLNNNAGTVTDPGTAWRGGAFSIGYVSGFNNHLVITNGAVVECSQASIGLIGAGSNRVTVAGNGARLDIGTYLLINQSDGPNDAVNIGPGGTVTTPYIAIGSHSTGTNFVNVTGGDLYVTNTVADAPLFVGSELLLNTGTATVDNLMITTSNGWMRFTAGTLHCRKTSITNNQQFVVGNGTNAANFHLLGGVHSFNDGLRISSNAMLSGCGTVNAVVVVDAGGAVVADCTPLVFTGSVTNNGTLRASNGNVLEAYGTVVNNGVIDLINGGVTNFHGTFINNGAILDSNSVVISQTSVAGSDILVKIQSFAGHMYQLQVRDLLDAGVWTDTGAAQSGDGTQLTFTDPGGATNMPARFHRVRCSP